MVKKKIKYADFPDMNTCKDIVLYGGKTGGDKKQYTFYNFDGEVETKTFAQVNYDLTGLGQYLYKLGLRGKKVAILSENSYYWIACYFSIITGKMTAIPMDPKLPDDDIIDIMVENDAVNACNLDGGSSTIMLYRDNYGRYGEAGEVQMINNYSLLQQEPRKMPTFFMVHPSDER